MLYEIFFFIKDNPRHRGHWEKKHIFMNVYRFYIIINGYINKCLDNIRMCLN